MKIVHHISEGLLLEYASGSLSEGWSLAVASHLSLCPGCRRRLDLMEAAGGSMLDTIECAETSVAGSWETMKSRISGQSNVEAIASRKASATSGGASRSAPSARSQPVLPEPLRSYVGGDIGDLNWKSLGRGAYHVRIKTGDGSTSVRLLRIPAGKPVPEHTHGGRELTLVLAGSFSDESGRFGRGDIEEADEDLMHQPVAGMEGDCICLAVTDAPLKFKSWIMRIVQPIIGI